MESIDRVRKSGKIKEKKSLDVLVKYTQDKRYVNGFEDTVLNEVHQLKEYHEFVSFFEGQDIDEFISNELTEEGALEVQISRLVHSRHLELCDRMIITFMPDDIEQYQPTSPQEIAVRKILNQDAFRRIGKRPEVAIECELFSHLRAETDPGREQYTQEDQNQLRQEIERINTFLERNRHQEKIGEFLKRREQLLSEAFRKILKNEATITAGFSIRIHKENGGE